MTIIKSERLLRRIPKCLRHNSRWFVTEPRGDPDSVPHALYSAVTLEPLRYGNDRDYTILEWAIQAWEDHEHWFDGVACRVNHPVTVLYVQDCMTPRGHVTKEVREVIRRIGGYWERTRSGPDIQGILHLQERQERQESRGGIIAGHRVYLCSEGICKVTGDGVPGFMGDPMQTNQEAFSAIIREMTTKAAVEPAARQLKLFD